MMSHIVLCGQEHWSISELFPTLQTSKFLSISQILNQTIPNFVTRLTGNLCKTIENKMN